MTHYEVLGVAPSASADEVRRAYLALARRHHPDFHGADAPRDQEQARRRMQEVNAAWHVLGDAGRRRAYDESLRPASATGWRPIDPDDDDDLDDLGLPADRVAARLPEDLAGPGEARHRWLAVAPAALMLAAVLCGVVGMVTAVLPLVALGGGLALVSLGLFVLAPIVVMSESARRSPPRP